MSNNHQKVSVKFDGTNWPVYREEIKSILEGEKNQFQLCLWHVANGVVTLNQNATNLEIYAWKCFQADIKRIILQSLHPKEKPSLQKLATGTEIWLKLERENGVTSQQQSTKTKVNKTRRDFYSKIFDDQKESMKEHLDALEEMAAMLIESGEDIITEFNMVERVLLSMEMSENQKNKDKADNIRHLADKRNLTEYNILRDTLISWYPMEKKKKQDKNGKSFMKKKFNSKKTDDEIVVNKTSTKQKSKVKKEKPAEETSTSSTSKTNIQQCEFCGLKNHQISTCKFYLKSKVTTQQHLQNRNNLNNLQQQNYNFNNNLPYNQRQFQQPPIYPNQFPNQTSANTMFNPPFQHQNEQGYFALATSFHGFGDAYGQYTFGGGGAGGGQPPRKQLPDTKLISKKKKKKKKQNDSSDSEDSVISLNTNDAYSIASLKHKRKSPEKASQNFNFSSTSTFPTSTPGIKLFGGGTLPGSSTTSASISSFGTSTNPNPSMESEGETIRKQIKKLVYEQRQLVNTTNTIQSQLQTINHTLSTLLHQQGILMRLFVPSSMRSTSVDTEYPIIENRPNLTPEELFGRSSDDESEDEDEDEEPSNKPNYKGLTTLYSFSNNFTGNKTTKWMFDTCDNQHMTGVKDYFIKYREFPKDMNNKVSGASSNFNVQAEGIGTIRLYTKNSKNENIYFELDDVIYLPSLKYNLFSPGQALEQGDDLQWDSKDKTCRVYRDGKEIIYADLNKRMWEFYAEPIINNNNIIQNYSDSNISSINQIIVNQNYSNTLFNNNNNYLPYQLSNYNKNIQINYNNNKPNSIFPTNFSIPTLSISDLIYLWHCRLGHISISSMINLLNHKIVEGVHIPLKDLKNFKLNCETCYLAKMKSKSYHKKPEQNYEETGGDIVTDLKGPISPTSIYGDKYWLIILELCKRFLVIFILKQKSETRGKLIEYNNWLFNQTGYKIKRLTSDKGKEYMNEQLKQYCLDYGIEHKLVGPDAPQMNGIAEIYNSIIKNLMNPLLQYSGLPTNLWPYAVKLGVMIRNSTSFTSLEEQKSPKEGFSGIKPNVKHWKVFGCVCYVYININKRTSTQKQAMKGIFLGYDEKSNNFIVWFPNINVIRDYPDVHFLEHVLYKDSEFCNKKIKQKEENEFVEEIIVKEEQSSDEESENENEIKEIKPDNNKKIKKQLQNDERNTIRTSTRETKGQTRKYNDYIHSSITFDISSTLFLAKCNYKSLHVKYEKDYYDYDFENENLLCNHSSKENNLDYQFGKEKLNYYLLNPEVYPKKINIPNSYEEAIVSPFNEQWKEAMDNEIKSLNNRKTYQLVPYNNNMKIMDTKWVYTLKYDQNGNIIRFKARLCARGFNLSPGFDYISSFSPVARMSSLRLFLALSVKRKLYIKQFDINNAYLNATLEIPVFSYQPKGYIDNNYPKYVCQFDKAIYGLPHAGRKWADELQNTLIQIGFKQNTTEPCLYLFEKQQIICMILVYVDDVLIASNNSNFTDKIQQHLNEKYGIKDIGGLKQYLGINISQDYNNNEITLNQENYIKNVIEKYDLKIKQHRTLPLPPNTKIYKDQCPLENSKEQKEMKNYPYRELIGSWIYLATSTRPDIAFSISQLAKMVDNPGKVHWDLLVYLSSYIANTSKFGIRYYQDNDTKLHYFTSDNYFNNSDEIISYCDSDWAGDLDSRKSISGYIIMFSGGPISWFCKKQTVIAQSTAEAEYVAAGVASMEIMHIKNIIREIFKEPLKPVILLCDNQSAIILVKDPPFSKATRHIGIKYHYVREMAKNKEIVIMKCKGTENGADIFTKVLSKEQFIKSRTICGIQNVEKQNHKISLETIFNNSDFVIPGGSVRK